MYTQRMQKVKAKMVKSRSLGYKEEVEIIKYEETYLCTYTKECVQNDAEG